MATKRELGVRVEELEDDLAAAIAVINSAVQIIVSLNKIIINQDEILTSSEVITQQVGNNPKGLSNAQMASLVRSFKEFPKQRWVKKRYLELRAEGKKKGKAIKTIVKEMKTPEIRDQFGAAYHPDHIRQAILKEMK
jgi:hypothetical protein